MQGLNRTRRKFLEILGAAGAAVGLSGAGSATAQEDNFVETFKLLGEISGWVGVEPESIEGVTNPTLRFEEVGGQYRLEWENGDGVGHNFVIRNADNESLVSTPLVTSEGTVTPVEFEATEEMDNYICEPHSGSMNGDIVLGPPDQYADFKEQYDVGFRATSDGWVGITPESIEGEVNPTIQLQEGTEYDFGALREVTRDDLNLAIVDSAGETIASTGTLNDHNLEESMTVEATTEMVAYLSEGASEQWGGEITVEPSDDGGDRQAAIDALVEESDYAFEGFVSAWEGLSPGEIEGTENPTIELEAGESYVFGWLNGDGELHNIAIWDENDNELFATERIDEEGATQTLEFEATTEAAKYVCDVHPTTMVGELVIEGGDNTDDDGTGDGDDGTDDGDDQNGDSPDDSAADDDGAGFGVITALAGLGAGAAAAMRRLRDSEE